MSNKPNLPTISMNSCALEHVSSENINNLFNEIFGIDVSLPDWASAPAEGNFFPSAQLCTRDGRVTGNAVLMWWTIVNGMPAAVVATDAGNVIIVNQAELEDMFYAPQFLMRDPLYAHLAGVVAANIEIPDEFRFLFEIGGVTLDDDEAADDFETYVDEVIKDLLVDPEVVEDLAFDDVPSFDISIVYSNGDIQEESFDTVEGLNEFMLRMGIPYQI